MNSRSSLVIVMLILATLYSCDKDPGNKSRNPPEIVSRDADTVFNDVPGEHHSGMESFDYNVVQLMDNVRKNRLFVEGLKKTALIDTLQEEGPYTIFAPVDNAFPWYDADTSSTGSESGGTARYTEEMLKAHIISGAVRMGDLAEGAVTVTNLNGTSLELRLENNTIVINDNIRTTTIDLNASNGVVHEVEELISPPSP